MIRLSYFPLMILAFCSFQLSVAAEVDLDLQIDPEIKRQFLSKEADIKGYRVSLNKDKRAIRELRDALKVAMMSDDQQRLQNILSSLIYELRRMQNNLAAQDSRIEQYRLSLFKVLRTSQKKRPYFKKPLINEGSIALGKSVYERMSDEDKRSVSSQISRILDARKELKKLDAINNRIPSSPYGSIRGIELKHTILALDRIRLNLEQEQCARLEAIAFGIIELYADKEFMEVSIEESDYNSFLESFDNIVDTFLTDEDADENPYAEYREGEEQ